MRKTAKELCTSYPGAFSRRQELLVALCQGTDLAAVGPNGGFGATVVGCRIIDCANKIIEETEQ